MISKVNEYLLKFLDATESSDLNFLNNDFIESNAILLHLTDTLYQKKVPSYLDKKLIEDKLYRVSLANSTISESIKGISLPHPLIKERRFDVYSIANTTRMQIEAFMTIFYLFFDLADTDELKYRCALYKIIGLKKQQNFKVSNLTKKSKLLYQRIANEIEYEIANLKSTEHYKKKTQSQIEKILKSKNSRQFKSNELLERSGLSAGRINQIWATCSNYSHTEYISDRQSYLYRKEPNELLSKIATLLWVNKILTVKLICLLRNTFPTINEEFSKLPEHRQVIIDKWIETFGG